VSDAHPHRFRDTFAVELLISGVAMERVPVLLGNQLMRELTLDQMGKEISAAAKMSRIWDRLNCSGSGEVEG